MQLTSPPFLGTLLTGQFLAPDGDVNAPGYSFASQATMGWFRRASSSLTYGSGGVAHFDLVGASIGLRSDTVFQFASSASATASKDTGVGRGAAGVVKLTAGASGSGGLSSVAKTPASLGGNTNDYSPGVGWFQRWSAAPAVNVTGMVAGADGETRMLWNVGANNITITNADALSAAANRFATATGAALVLTPNKCVLAVYDLTSTVWRATLLP